MFLTEKQDKSIKGRMVYNGKPSREWHDKYDSAIPTASLEAILLTGTIDAYEGWDTLSLDIPNAFIQTHMPRDQGADVSRYSHSSSSIEQEMIP